MIFAICKKNKTIVHPPPPKEERKLNDIFNIQTNNNFSKKGKHLTYNAKTMFINT